MNRCLNSILSQRAKWVDKTTVYIPSDLMSALNVLKVHYNERSPGTLASKLIYCAGDELVEGFQVLGGLAVPITKVAARAFSDEVSTYLLNVIGGAELSRLEIPFPTTKLDLPVLELRNGDQIPVFSGAVPKSYEASYLLAKAIAEVDVLKDTPIQKRAVEIRDKLRKALEAYFREQLQWLLALENYLDITGQDELYEEFRAEVMEPLSRLGIL